MENIGTRVKELIASILDVGTDEIRDETAIGDIAEWDSLRHIRIISAVEQEFGFLFTPGMIMDLEDVGDIVAAAEAAGAGR